MALNLAHGATTCGQRRLLLRYGGANNVYDRLCADHVELRGLDADSYHFSLHMTRNYDNSTFYREYYKNDNIKSFYRHYIEFFIRLQHLTIFQLPVDRTHYKRFVQLLSMMVKDFNNIQLPEPKSFYQTLYRKFCGPESSLYCNDVSDEIQERRGFV